VRGEQNPAYRQPSGMYMSKIRLNKRRIPTDRWSAVIASPVDISGEIDTDKHGELVIFHGGWGKGIERYGPFLVKLAENGYLPIAIDTRYVYGDRQLPRRGIRQSWRVGDTNPYFSEADRAGNRWKYRKPTVLLEILRALDLEEEPRKLVGHSEGGRVQALVARATPNQTTGLYLVNSAGTGDSSGGANRMIQANRNSIREMRASDDGTLVAVMSALGSVAHTASHLNRFWHEKTMLQEADTWAELDKLEGIVDVTVFHALYDELVSFDVCAVQARSRPWVDFIPTAGSHRNIYDRDVQDLIVQAMAKE